ncbi:hypothetical protein, partial [Heyndrickxia coagulans]|uniref:hypothetical protein n=1 Tax=Heyndrickxia coagulans TaxID=1398 RepID=UPI00214DCAA3
VKKNKAQIVKVCENTYSIEGRNTQEIELLEQVDLTYLRRQQFDMIHIGSVQIVVTPLVRLGIDFPVMICIRDSRIKDINKSLFAVVETNLCKGPTYFDCFPNLLLDCIEDK